MVPPAVFFFIKHIFCLLLLSAAVSACSGPPNEYVPEQLLVPAPRIPVSDLAVTEQVELYRPAPRTNGLPPEDCDIIRCLRFRPRTEDGTPKEVRAVVILIPGYLGGAGSFSLLGPQLVSLAEEQGLGSIEVWALDRRSNCLEDLTGMEAAEASGDPGRAVSYYYQGGAVNGKTFDGFLTSQELPFLSEFGLSLVMDDISAVLDAKIPDRETRSRTVFVGGHSLGARLAAFFAGWDFDNTTKTTADAGYNSCAGLIGLDMSPALAGGGTRESAYRRELDALRRGASNRLSYVAAVPLTPEALAIPEILGMYARYAPDEESRFFRDAAVSPDVDRLLRVFNSGNLEHYLAGTPSIRDYRYTNEALLGIFLDDNFQPVSIAQMSLGFLCGGPVVQKHFPLLFDSGRLFIAADADNETLYRWADFDTIGDAADPDFQDITGTITFTTMQDEVTDIQDAALAMFQGPSNFFEWYFPARLGLDMQAAGQAFAPGYGLYLLHPEGANALPHLALLSSDIPGYNHLDFLCAASDRPERRENEVLAPLLDFILQHSTGSVTVE